MHIGLLITGDEQLSGKRQDRHLARVIELLAARGMALGWATLVGDDEARIAQIVATARAQGELLFCCGGIGATPDDRTRQAVARAFGVEIRRHPQAEALITAEYGDQAWPYRVLMADLPAGAVLIPNPVNRVAGFSLGDCHFVPGFPEMAWPMIEWVLDTRYPQLRNADPPVEYRLRAVGSAAESDLLPLMQETLARHPQLALSSLPSRGLPGQPRHIEFGFKGPRAVAAAAYRAFEAALRAQTQLTVQPLQPPGADA
jgi:molybdopterin-biosynthesis enzyme MoeA-like protein